MLFEKLYDENLAPLGILLGKGRPHRKDPRPPGFHRPHVESYCLKHLFSEILLIFVKCMNN